MRATSLPLIVALATTVPVSAHEVKLTDGRSVDYTGIHDSDGKRSCCGNLDCRPVASHWLRDGNLAVQTDPDADLWVPVPPDAIIYVTPEALRETSDITHACWRGPPQQPIFFCVFPAAETS